MAKREASPYRPRGVRFSKEEMENELSSQVKLYKRKQEYRGNTLLPDVANLGTSSKNVEALPACEIPKDDMCNSNLNGMFDSERIAESTSPNKYQEFTPSATSAVGVYPLATRDIGA